MSPENEILKNRLQLCIKDAVARWAAEHDVTDQVTDELLLIAWTEIMQEPMARLRDRMEERNKTLPAPVQAR